MHSITLFISLYFAASCTSNNFISFTLDAAENLIQVRPDSALNILQTIDGQQITQKKQYARYALLFNQALDKNNLPLPGDSLINIAIDYYTKKNELRKLGWTYLYLGNIYAQKDSITLATYAYLHSLELLQRVDDDYLLGLITNRIASFYQEQHSYEQALTYFRQSLSAFQRIGNKPNEGQVLSQIGRLMYIFGKSIDSIQYFYNKAKDIAVDENDMEFLMNLSIAQAAILRAQKEYVQAKQLLFATIQEKNHGINPLDCYPLLSFIYLDLNQIDSARYFMQQVLQDDNASAERRAGAIAGLRRIEEKAGNYEIALQHAARYKELSDSISKVHHDYDIRITEEKHQLQKLSKAYFSQKIRHILIIVCLSLLSVAIVYSVRHWWRKLLKYQKKQHDEYKVQRQESDKELIRLSLSQNWNRTRFLKEFDPDAIFRTEKAFFSKVFTTANLAYPGLLEWLKECYPELKDDDIVLTCLLFSNIDVKALCTLFNIPDNRAMYTRCSRLYKKLDIKTNRNDRFSFRNQLIDLCVKRKIVMRDF